MAEAQLTRRQAPVWILEGPDGTDLNIRFYDRGRADNFLLTEPATAAYSSPLSGFSTGPAAWHYAAIHNRQPTVPGRSAWFDAN